jgi:hypothetical protein
MKFGVHVYKNGVTGEVSYRVCPDGVKPTEDNLYIALEFRNGAQTITRKEQDFALKALLESLGRAASRKWRPATIWLPQNKKAEACNGKKEG